MLNARNSVGIAIAASVFQVGLVQGAANLEGEWQGTSSCTCFETSLLKQWETSKEKRDVSLSIDAREPGSGAPYAWTYGYGLDGVHAVKIGNSLLTPDTGEGALLSCDNVAEDYLEIGLGAMGVFEFDLVHGSKDTMGVTYIFSGATDGALICKCTGQLERVSMEPVWLVTGNSCESISVQPNPNSSAWNTE